MWQHFCILYYLVISIPTLAYSAPFIINDHALIPYKHRTDALLLASCGRSGSTMLTELLDHYAYNYVVLKTHMLPPEESYKGKAIFIYSNPNQCAESLLHLTLTDSNWRIHFKHMESSDLRWYRRINDLTRQSSTNNLLLYDAFGIKKQLLQWLRQMTTPDHRPPSNAQILAIKYEHLWDQSTIDAIKKFLNIDQFELPPKRERGYHLNEQDPRESKFKNLYNQGTQDFPRYPAYDPGYQIWEDSPPYQFLKLKKNRDR